MTETLPVSLDDLPAPFPARLKRLPAKELPGLFDRLETDPQILITDPDNADARVALDRAIRYLESKTRLVNMMLLTRIRSDGYDMEAAEDIAQEMLSRHLLADVHAAYDRRSAS